MKDAIEYLKTLRLDTYNKDFLLTWERSDDEIRGLIALTQLLQDRHRSGQSIKAFDSGLAISIFRDQSTRTRFSFASATNALGLGLSELDEVKTQTAHGETVRETAHMISFLTQVIGIRDDLYLGEGNRYMRQVSAAVEEGYRQEALAQRPCVINLQCDIDHPTQTLADLAHLRKHFGSLENLRGKKMAVSWAYSPSYGKPLSVPQGLLGLFSRFGLRLTLAHPPGYTLLPEVVDLARAQSLRSGGSLRIVENMEEAFADADIVYPKSWAPYSVMQRRTELLKQGNGEGLRELEKECLAENAKQSHWECNDSLMRLTGEGKALYMHCLPADISGLSCERGEVSQEVFERYRLATYLQAGYKPFVIAAMILLTRFADPGEVIRRFSV